MRLFKTKFLLLTPVFIILTSCQSTVYEDIIPGRTIKYDVESKLGKPIKHENNTYTYIAKTDKANLLTRIQYKNNIVNTFETDFYNSGFSNIRLHEVFTSHNLTKPDFTEHKNGFDLSYFSMPEYMFITSKGLQPASRVTSITYLSRKHYLIDKAIHLAPKNIVNEITGLDIICRPVTFEEQKAAKINEAGFIITQIPEDSSLYSAGLRRGDIILLINNKKFSTLEELKKYTAALKNNSPISMLIKSAENKILFKNFIFKISPSTLAGFYYYNESAVNLKNKNYNSALQNAENALVLNPGSQDYKFRQASIYMSLKKYSKAKPILVKLALKYPDNLNYNLKTAIALYKSGDLSYSKNFLFKILEKNPEDKDALFYLAWVQSGEGKQKDAVATINKLLAKEPEKAKFLIAKAAFLFKAKQYKSTVNYCKEVIKVKPEWYYSYFLTGQALEKEGENEEALKYLEKSLELNPRQKTIDIIRRIHTSPDVIINKVQPEYNIYEKINGKSYKGVRFNLSLQARDMHGVKKIYIFAMMKEKNTHLNVPTTFKNYTLKNGKTGLERKVSITPDNMNNIKVQFFFPYDSLYLANKKHDLVCEFEVFHKKQFVTAAKQNWCYNGGYNNINKNNNNGNQRQQESAPGRR